MSDKQFDQLLARIAKLEAEVERLKSGSGVDNGCGPGLLGIFGAQKDNPFFSEVIAEIDAARSLEKAAVSTEPVKKRARRRVATPKK
jgi:cell division protein FtsB